MRELYLYQTIHLHKGHPRLVAEHIGALNEASRKLFGQPYAPNAKQLTTRIVALAAAEGYPCAVSGFVRLELLPDGTDRLLTAGVSLYEGYALRSIMPDAAVFEYTLPQHDAPTSAHEAAALLVHKMAERSGASAAIQCDSEGILYSIDGAPLFAVRGKEVFTASAFSGVHHESTAFQPPVGLRVSLSVERDLGIRAVQAAGLTLRDEPAQRAELPHYDELFCVDHRGVTALAHCDGNPYMSLSAERVAAAMEGLFKGGK